MTIRELKEMLKGRYADIEYYKYKDGRNKKIHTDFIEWIEDPSPKAEIEHYMLMDEEEYNDTILANSIEEEPFISAYGSADAQVLIVILK